MTSLLTRGIVVLALAPSALTFAALSTGLAQGTAANYARSE